MIYLVFLALLAVVTPVGAEIKDAPRTPCLSLTVEKGEVTAVLCTGTNTLTTVLHDDCYAQMEAAMRAMEPLIYQKDEEQVRTFHNTVGYKKAWELWHAAKRECWRTP